MSGLEGLLAGRVLGGRYRIEEVIGRGGMGAVYRATDERLGRKVAVKVITVAGAADPELRERVRARFEREARAAAGLPHHPNVVPVYDYGSDAALGLDYLVMELLHGEDLATRLARTGAPPLATGIWILREAARGVAVGHRVGLIHRDVKPGNIFLAEAPRGEVQVRVLDFGIAKLMAEEDTLNSLTQDGRAPLSPAYASPEQLRGLQRLTPASDVFSLGAIGYQLLTGERPFSEADRNRMSLGMPVEVPSARSRNPSIPLQVEEIVHRALAFDAEERFSDADAMAMALERAMRDIGSAPLPSYAPPPAYGAAPAYAAGAAGEEEDRTQLAPPYGVGEDDRTLLEVPLPPVGGPPSPPAARVAAPAAPAPPPKKRSKGGVFVWSFVLLALVGAVIVIVLSSRGRPRGLGEELGRLDTTALDTTLAEAPAETVEAPPPAPDPAALNEEGNRLFRDGNYPAALQLFRQASEAEPDNREYRYNYGVALLKVGMAAEAADQLGEVIRTGGMGAGAFYNLAQARLALGDTVAAVTALQRAMALAVTPAEQGAVQRLLDEISAARVQTLPPPPVDTLAPRPDSAGGFVAPPPPRP
jgi:tetratricopeptide (TPR) repeat protein/tRNA A-37 threonylcarbamoyl transferase component Bud32